MNLFRNPLVMSFFVAAMGAFHPFLILPMAVHHLSSTQLSLYLFFILIQNLILLIGSGFTQSIERRYAYIKAQGDLAPHEARDLFSTASRVYIFGGSLAFVVLVIFGTLTGWNLMQLNHHNPRDWAALGVLSLAVGVNFQNFKYTSFYHGWGLIGEAKRIEFLMLLIRVLASAFALIWGGGNLGLTTAVLTGFVFQNWILRRRVLRSHAHLLGGKYSSSLFQSVFPLCWRTGLLAVAGSLVGQVPGFIISQIPDTHKINGFLMTYRLVAMMVGVCLIPIFVYFPQVIGHLSKNDYKKNQKLMAHVISLSLFVYLLGSCFLLFLNLAEGFNNHHKHYFTLLPFSQLLMVLMMYLLELHQSLHGALYSQSNHIPFLKPTLISGALLAVFGWFSLHLMGVVGLILCQFIVQLGWNYWFSVYLNLKLNQWRWRDYLTSLVRTGLRFKFLSPPEMD